MLIKLEFYQNYINIVKLPMLEEVLINGVHSTIEPLIYKNLVCHGPNYDLLDEAREMLKNDLGVIIKNSKDIYNLFSSLINDNKIINFISDKKNSSKMIFDKINEIL